MQPNKYSKTNSILYEKLNQTKNLISIVTTVTIDGRASL